MKPHKHAELIKAWADGAEIQVFNGEKWLDSICPTWHSENQYRIKRKTKPDEVSYLALNYPHKNKWFELDQPYVHDCIKLIFDGETGKLKSAEVLK